MPWTIQESYTYPELKISFQRRIGFSELSKSWLANNQHPDDPSPYMTLG
jgi:hypothetical protein